jgi:hypothetical protein
MQSEYLSLDAAAQRAQNRGLPCSKSSLRKHLRDGAGPLCLRFGPRALVLPTADFDVWIEARLSEMSPSGKAEGDAAVINTPSKPRMGSMRELAAAVAA